MSVNNIDYATITSISSTVKTLGVDGSPEMPPQAKGAMVTVETVNLRMRDDGTDPTASEGHLIYVGDVLTYDSWTTGVNWKSVFYKTKFIQAVASTTGNLRISWYD